MRQVEKGFLDEETAFDPRTGELEKGSLVWVPDRFKSSFGREFFLMTQDALSLMADHRKTLGVEGFAVFGKLVKRLDFENYIQVSQTEIADELEMKPSNVSRAIKKLAAIGIIGIGPRVGTARTYRLHPETAWKGKPKAHTKARDDARKLGWTLIPGGKTPSETQPLLPGLDE